MTKSYAKEIVLKITASFILLSAIVSCNDLPGGLRNGQIVLYGEYNQERFAYSLDFIGDVNGDGFVDVACGAPDNYLNGAGSGMVYVFLGPFSPLESERTPDIRISGYAGSGFGESIAGGFDLNSDGLGDFAVSSSKSIYGSSDNGDVFIYFGSSSIFSTRVEPLDAVEEAGVIIAGSPIVSTLTSKGFGARVERLGDFDRDGVTDIGVSAPFSQSAGALNAGALFVFLGGKSLGTGRYIDSSLADIIFVGDRANGYFGSSFDRALNLDGQGRGRSLRISGAVGDLWYGT